VPRFNDIIQTFQNGEVSPKFHGRTDYDIYKRSCRKVLNMIPQQQGGISRRVGTEFIADKVTDISSGATDLIKEMAAGARCIPFVVSEDESYVIIFPGIDSEANLPFVYIYNVNEDRFINLPHFASEGITPIPNGNSAGLFTNAQVLRELQYVQTGDRLIFVHSTFPPQVITRTRRNGFTWLSYTSTAGSLHGGTGTRIEGQAFRTPNTNTAHLIDAGAVTVGNTTLTSSTSFFDPDHVGAFFAFQDAGTVGWGYVTAYNSATSVDFTVVDALPAAASAGSGTAQWIEGAWSTYRGFPRTVALWNGRIFFGGTDTDVDTIWASQTYDIFEMTTETTLDPGATLTEDMPQSFTIASDRANVINWMFGSKNDFLVGTRGREYSIRSFTIEEIDVRPQTGYGSEYIQPTIVDDVPVYVQRGFNKLREIIFDDRTAGYVSPEVTFFAEHMPRLSQGFYADAESPKIKNLAYQPLDNNVLWIVDNNGHLFGTTKSRENSINAFHRHTLGGTSGSDEPPKVLSIASVPARNGVSDNLFMIVQREIDGNTVISFERMTNDYYELTLHADANERRRIPLFSDCAKMFRTHAGANFFARLFSSSTATEAGGSTTATVTGTVTYAYEKALFDGSSYIDYDGTSNADVAQTGCIRFTLHPNTFTAQGLIAICKAASDADNLIQLEIGASQDLVLTVNDSTGAAIINAVSLGVATEWATNRLEAHIIEINYDLTTGATRVFVNGKQLGSTISSTGTRDTSIDLIRLGAKYDATDPVAANTMISDLVIFNSVQHTEDHEVFEYLKKAVTVSRLEHLEGEEVTVLGDGIELGTFTVASGIITLEDTYDTIVVGLPYGHVLETQSIEAGSGIGSAQGRPTRVDTLALRFNSTAQCKFGRDEDNQEEITFRTPQDALDAAVPLFTGDKVFPFDGAYEPDSRLVITGNAPVPCNITCLVARGATND